MNLTKILFTIGQSVIIYFIILGAFMVGYWFYENVNSGTFSIYTITCLLCEKEYSSKIDFHTQVWLFIHRFFCQGESKNDI